MLRQSPILLQQRIVWLNKPGQKSIFTANQLRLFCRISLGTALVLITWLALTPSPPEAAGFSWDKANHSAAFLVLGVLTFFSLNREWLGYLGLALYGVGIEILQWAMGFRVFELWDMVANLIGIATCILCQPILLRLPIIGSIKQTVN